MIPLSNGCARSKMVIFPKIWEEKEGVMKQIIFPKNVAEKESLMKKPWYIFYRFYDLQKKARPIFIKGMNYKTEWLGRFEATELLLSDELKRLQIGYNPNKNELPKNIDFEVDPNTPLYTALNIAHKKVKCVHEMTIGLKSVLTCSTKSAKTVNVYNMPLNQVKRRHMVKLLEQCRIDRTLSPGSFNQYRSYLRMMFKELVKIEAIESNPITDEIEREVEVEKIRKTLTPEELTKVDLFLHEHHYKFWRHVHIFFASGSRSTELKNLQVKDVDLVRQVFTIITSKRRRKKIEEVKAIYDDVLPLWKELLENRKPEEYVFGKNFEPGIKPVGADYGSRHWKSIIKGRTAKSKIHKKGKARPGIGITADYYALKHLNADNIADKVGIELAKKHLSHTSTKTTRIYAVNERERELEILKKVGKRFA